MNHEQDPLSGGRENSPGQCATLSPPREIMENIFSQEIRSEGSILCVAVWFLGFLDLSSPFKIAREQKSMPFLGHCFSYIFSSNLG